MLTNQEETIIKGWTEWKKKLFSFPLFCIKLNLQKIDKMRFYPIRVHEQRHEAFILLAKLSLLCNTALSALATRMRKCFWEFSKWNFKVVVRNHAAEWASLSERCIDRFLSSYFCSLMSFFFIRFMRYIHLNPFIMIM